MTTINYLVHHKVFDLPLFYVKSANFNEPSGFTLKTAFDCGQYSAFSIYSAVGESVSTLKTFLDNKYGSSSVHIIYQINEITSAGWGDFQTIQDLKDRANNL